ncbi:VapE domain-containing protein [Apilactobacillus micheneri]|uniref:VapE domain-containing protein n=1 Tax=Apilactobacillus micheneri TaxID=1899430 RepID=UPI0011298AE9|nr:VapE domain-containing protein [Apilactobacillus micheneri]
MLIIEVKEAVTKWQYIQELADKGICMYPLIKGTKKPAIKDMLNNATSDIEQLKEWFKPNENGLLEYDVAVNPSKSNLIVIDVDNHNNTNGAKWIHEKELAGYTMQAKVSETTKNKGIHYFYINDLDIDIKDGTHIDSNNSIELKTQSTIIYPSAGYKPINSILDNDIDVMPKWLKECIKNVVSSKNKPIATHKRKKHNNIFTELIDLFQHVIHKGERNNKLAQITSKLYAMYFDDKGVKKTIEYINDAYCDYPLPQSEINNMLKSKAKQKHMLIKVDDYEIQQNRNKIPLKCYANGVPKPNFATNFKLICSYDNNLKNLIKYNEFSNAVFIKKGNKWVRWDDTDSGKIRVYVENKYNFTANNNGTMYQGIEQYALEHSYNPVKDMINKEQWDGVNRVDTLFIDYLGAEDNSYNRMVARKFMVGAIARVFHPGCKFDLMPILLGSQGLGKSGLIDRLASGYFENHLSRLGGSNKDDTMKLQDSWLVEIAELEAFNKSNSDSAKAFITSQEDKYRKPYGAAPSTYYRHNVFIGTTNKAQFLNDQTGNRRYLPVECGINKATKHVLKQSNGQDDLDDYVRYQIYAEAKNMYDNGELIYLTDSEEKEADSKRQTNEVYDVVAESVKSYLDMKIPKNWDDYDEFQRTQYYIRVFQENRYSSKYEDKKDLDVNDLVEMNAVSTKELLSIPLNKNNNAEIQGSPRSLSRRVSNIMSGVNDWKQYKNINVHGKYLRGYKRI